MSDATCLVGLSKPELPSHLTTSGTGFTAALWERSWVPLRTVFGWPLSYVTDQFWKTWCTRARVCACTFMWGNIWKDGCWCESKCSAFSWTVFCVGWFLCAWISHIISLKMASLSWGVKKKKPWMPSSSASTWQLYGWLCDWHGHSLLFHRRSAPETTKYLIVWVKSQNPGI